MRLGAHHTRGPARRPIYLLRAPSCKSQRSAAPSVLSPDSSPWSLHVVRTVATTVCYGTPNNSKAQSIGPAPRRPAIQHAALAGIKS
jgi:hypothetical protein